MDIRNHIGRTIRQKHTAAVKVLKIKAHTDQGDVHDRLITDQFLNTNNGRADSGAKDATKHDGDDIMSYVDVIAKRGNEFGSFMLELNLHVVAIAHEVSKLYDADVEKRGHPANVVGRKRMANTQRIVLE